MFTAHKLEHTSDSQGADHAGKISTTVQLPARHWMPSPLSRARGSTHDNLEPVGDCLECRLIGTGAMLSFSAYFAYLTQSGAAWTSHRKFSACMSIGFAAAGLFRFLA